jgi:O-antigen biosynthesis protein
MTTILPTVSILVLAHNKRRYTERALAALLESQGARFEAVLADNGSTDETPRVFERFAAAARDRGWQAKVLRFETNLGAVEGRNRALRETSGDYIALCDNDVVVGRRRWAEVLIARLRADPSIGVLGPKILFAAPPHRIQCAGCVVGKGGRVGFRGRGEPGDAPEWNRLAEVQAVTSAFWLMPRPVLERVGEFDMQFHPVQFEDIDYCYRIRQAGWRAVYDPSFRVFHFENVTTGELPSLPYRYLTVKNGLKFKRKWAAVFSKEGGPEDASMAWKDIASAPFEAVGELPLDD